MMREIGTLVPSSQESVAGSDYGLPGFVPRGAVGWPEEPAEEAEPTEDAAEPTEDAAKPTEDADVTEQ